MNLSATFSVFIKIFAICALTYITFIKLFSEHSVIQLSNATFKNELVIGIDWQERIGACVWKEEYNAYVANLWKSSERNEWYVAYYSDADCTIERKLIFSKTFKTSSTAENNCQSSKIYNTWTVDWIFIHEKTTMEIWNETSFGSVNDCLQLQGVWKLLLEKEARKGSKWAKIVACDEDGKLQLHLYSNIHCDNAMAVDMGGKNQWPMIALRNGDSVVANEVEILISGIKCYTRHK